MAELSVVYISVFRVMIQWELFFQSSITKLPDACKTEAHYLRLGCI